MSSKVIWQKSKDYVPTVEVVAGNRARQLNSINQTIARASRADRELKLNIAKDHQ